MLTEAVSRYMHQQYSGLQQALRLTDADLKREYPVVDDRLLLGKSREEQVVILSLDAYASELVRQAVVDQITHECNLPVSDIFLRGTGYTGLFPLDDLDISHYGSHRLYLPRQWPQKIMGIPVSWGHIPREEFADCMASSLRMAASVLQSQPLTPVSEEVDNILGKTRSTLLEGDGRYHFLLYRFFEEERTNLPWKKMYTPASVGEYKIRKELPGSKRTIQRISWSLQFLDPELSSQVNPNVLFMQAYFKHLIPYEIVSSAFRVMRMIKSDLYEESSFHASLALIHRWYLDSLAPRVHSIAHGHLPAEYISDVNLAFDPNTPPETLNRIIKSTDTLPEGYQKWLILWIASHNTAGSATDLLSLWNRFLGRMAYRNMLRNLLRNPSFPFHLIRREETVYDPHLVECFDIVKSVRSF